MVVPTAQLASIDGYVDFYVVVEMVVVIVVVLLRFCNSVSGEFGGGGGEVLVMMVATNCSSGYDMVFCLGGSRIKCVCN